MIGGGDTAAPPEVPPSSFVPNISKHPGFFDFEIQMENDFSSFLHPAESDCEAEKLPLELREAATRGSSRQQSVANWGEMREFAGNSWNLPGGISVAFGGHAGIEI